jgi:hypothetical protein
VNGEDIHWKPGQKAIFTGINGKTARVTIKTGKLINAVGGATGACMDVIFDDEGLHFLVRVKQLSIVPAGSK